MTRIEELQAVIATAYTEIKAIQDECSHPKTCLTKKHGSNTGNYDPHADCYWTEFKCGLCGKAWTEDGSK